MGRACRTQPSERSTMEKAETSNQSGAQPDVRKNRWPVVAAIAGAVVLALAIVGLNFAGLISLPFLPKSPELVLLRAVGDVAHDGTFDVVANADTDAELSIESLGQKAASNVHLTATAAGMARDFDANDLSKLNIPDGSFAADCTLALDVGFFEGETENLHAAGTFDLALADGEICYHLQEPIDFEGAIQFDTSALAVEKTKAMKRSIALSDKSSIDLSDIHDMKIDGDVVTFTVSTASLDTSAACDLLEEILRPTGIEVVSAEANLSDFDVSVDLGTAGSVRGRVTGTMGMTAHGVERVDLPSWLPSVPIDIGLAISVPIDIEIALS